MKISGIYKIQSIKKPSRCYIGSAKNISSRWGQHLGLLKKNKHHSIKLQNHFNKYGESDLIFIIILGCDKEDLVKIEQYFIDSYNPWFNICPKAYSSLGLKRSAETNLKHSLATKGRKTGPMSPERCLLNSRKGHEVSEETRLKISNTLKGKPLSEERKQKISKTLKGRPQFYSWTGRKQTSEHRTNESNAHIGKKRGPHSEATIIKIRESRLRNNKLRHHG